MPASAFVLTVDEERMVSLLEETIVRLDGAHCEAILDFSSVRRIDSEALEALEDFAQVAGKKGVKVMLRSVSVDVYKVLTLVKLTHKVSFLH